MLIIPTQAIASQTLQVALANQACALNVYQKTYGLFCDLSVAGSPIVAGVICLNLVKIVRLLYLGFIGDFMFVDTQGSSNPVYTGLGSQYQLVYLEASDLPPNVG